MITDPDSELPHDAAFFVGHALDDLECADVDLNRIAARRATRIVEAVALARRHTEVYVRPPGSDDAELAERAVVLEIALRLKLSEDQVRSICSVARQAIAHLPLLWRTAQEGFASMHLVERAVAALRRVRAPEDASEAELEAQRRAAAAIDEATSEWALRCSPETFLRRLRVLVARLDTRGEVERRARGLRDRRVILDSVDENGMSWLSIHLPAEEALAAFRRLSSAAKRRQKDRRECRTRDQIRADLASAWLRGIGTSTAVKTKVFVTIPVQLLGGGNAAQLPEPVAEIVGHGPIDRLTAAQMFLEAEAFHRVIIDPIRSVVLDMDRRSRRATRAQREWLVLQHGTCARDGCDRLALDADIDHRIEWARGGKTDLADLRPLCPRDHVHRHRTAMAYRSRPDGSVQVVAPTGFSSEPPPPF